MKKLGRKNVCGVVKVGHQCLSILLFTKANTSRLCTVQAATEPEKALLIWGRPIVFSNCLFILVLEVNC